MLCWLRRSKRLLVPVAVTLGAMVLVGTADWRHVNDAEQFSIPVLHDHSAHDFVLKAPPASEENAGEHCYLCHWLRTLQNGLGAASAHGLTTSENQHLQPAHSSSTRDLFGSLLPARAPPL
jgi:hypothetical protein